MLFMEEKTQKEEQVFGFFWGGVGLACDLGWPQTLEFAEVPP